MHRLAAIALLWLLTISAATTHACSAVLLTAQSHPIVARNYDWYIGHALVIVNQTGIEKRALSLNNPVEWTSKFGSVTINQYGRELPNEGMNEAGLTLAVLWLTSSEYPKPDDRPSVTTAQWIQYQLDTASTVEQVIASDKKIRITTLGGAKVHYLVADASGDCAVIEFLRGKQVVHRGRSLPHTSITNNTCVTSLKHLRRHTGFGGHWSIPTRTDSLSRYVRLTSQAEAFDRSHRPARRNRSKQEPATADDQRAIADEAFEVLHSVANPNSTQWQSVFDLQNRQLYFRTRDHKPIRSIDLRSINFGNHRPVQVLTLEAALQGDIAGKFRDYTTADNRQLVERAFPRSDFIGVSNLSKALVERVIRYPDESCKPVKATLPAGE